MNYKLEKFWNKDMYKNITVLNNMNYKLEKFWNVNTVLVELNALEWTINLKSFEISYKYFLCFFSRKWTINLKSFEIE